MMFEFISLPKAIIQWFGQIAVQKHISFFTSFLRLFFIFIFIFIRNPTMIFLHSTTHSIFYFIWFQNCNLFISFEFSLERVCVQNKRKKCWLERFYLRKLCFAVPICNTHINVLSWKLWGFFCKMRNKTSLKRKTKYWNRWKQWSTLQHCQGRIENTRQRYMRSFVCLSAWMRFSMKTII